jgi:hypothetical protein
MKTVTDSTPLIVRTLALEFGSAARQHIGLFADQAAGPAAIPAAQLAFQHSLQSALRQTCQPGSGVLLVGDTLAALRAALQADGYDARQVASLDALDAVHADETASAQPTNAVRCIVVAGTYHYLQQLPILSRCRELLRDGGRLFVFGEFLLDDSAIRASTIANLSSLQALAARLGYRVQAEHDLSADALHSVRLFLPLLQRHVEALDRDVDCGPEKREAVTAMLTEMQSELESGRRCYRMLELEMPGSEHLVDLGEYALAEYADRSSFAISEIADLFEQSFEKPFNVDLWQWKYDGGDGKCVVARIGQGGDIVAHYGGAPRKILYFGTPALAIQVCDVMVLPEERRQYGRSSLFFKVAATFLEREIGNTVGHLLGFGFPNQKAMNIATRLGLYEKTDDFVQLEFPPVQSDTAIPVIEELDIESEEHREAVDALWSQMSGAFADGIIGCRDSDYIRYRYFTHPYGRGGSYRRLLVREAGGGRYLACVILKPHEGAALVMDLICAPEHMSSVLQQIRAWQMLSDPQQPLRMWLTRGWLPTLETQGVIVNELGIEIPCNSWNPGPAAATLYGKWWLTAGDMDFM